MFGYIMIHKDELKIRDYNKYCAYYCGLCHELKKRHGELARLTLTYDMTFLVILLTGLYEVKTAELSKRCILHPAKKQPLLINRFTQYAADMGLLLSYYNLKDDWRDEKKLLSFAMSEALRHSCLKVAEKYPRQAAAVKLSIEKLTECEQSRRKELDLAAGYTGELLGAIFSPRKDEWSGGLQRLGFYLGKFIYLNDAWEDLHKDKKSGNYNPLIYYEAEPQFEKMVNDVLIMMAAACAKEFERLPILKDADILRNVLYSGIWTRYNRDRGQTGDTQGVSL